MSIDFSLEKWILFVLLLSSVSLDSSPLLFYAVSELHGCRGVHSFKKCVQF